MPEIEWLPVPAARFPSPPVWHGGERALYWSDIDACRLFRLNAADGAVETLLDDGRPTGAIVPQADGSLLLFRDRGNVVAMRGGALAETVVPDIADFRKTRCAAAAADKSGRVVCAFLSDSLRLCASFQGTEGRSSLSFTAARPSSFLLQTIKT